jgi:hypothetical protein
LTRPVSDTSLAPPPASGTVADAIDRRCHHRLTPPPKDLCDGESQAEKQWLLRRATTAWNHRPQDNLRDATSCDVLRASERPPRPVPPLTAKPRRRPFVVLALRHTEGAPVPGQDVSSLGGSLTRWVLPAPWCLAGSPWRLLSPPLLPPSPCLHVTHTHQASLICSCHRATTPRPRHWTTMPPGTLGSTLRQHFH